MFKWDKNRWTERRQVVGMKAWPRLFVRGQMKGSTWYWRNNLARLQPVVWESNRLNTLACEIWVMSFDDGAALCFLESLNVYAGMDATDRSLMGVPLNFPFLRKSMDRNSRSEKSFSPSDDLREKIGLVLICHLRKRKQPQAHSWYLARFFL